MTASPYLRHSGSSSFSIRRSSRLYGGCSLTYDGSPSRSLVASASITIHAGWVEQPM